MVVHEDLGRVTLIGDKQLSIINLETGCLENSVYYSLDVGSYARSSRDSEYITFWEGNVLYFGSLKEEEDSESTELVARFRLIASLDFLVAQNCISQTNLREEIRNDMEEWLNSGYEDSKDHFSLLKDFQAHRLDEETIVAIYRFPKFNFLLKMVKKSPDSDKFNLELENGLLEQKFELENWSMHIIPEWKALIGFGNEISGSGQKSRSIFVIDLHSYEILGRKELMSV